MPASGKYPLTCVTSFEEKKNWTRAARAQVLMKAIKLYVSSTMSSSDLSAASVLAPRELRDTKDETETYSAARELRKLHVRTVPPEDRWIVVRKRSSANPSEVRMKLQRSTKSSGGKKSGSSGGDGLRDRTKQTSTVSLCGNGPRAEQCIAAFVADAYAWYSAELRECGSAKKSSVVFVTLESVCRRL